MTDQLPAVSDLFNLAQKRGLNVTGGSSSLLPDIQLQARPIQKQKPSPLEEWIATTLKGGMPQDELGPTKFDTYRYLRQIASQGPTPEDIKAGEAGIDAQSAQDLLQSLQGIPTPQRQTLTAPEFSPLLLPGIPTRQRPQVDPVSMTAAGILGLVSPQNAGMFGAAALHGALQRNQQDYEDAQRQYQEQFQQSVAKHSDEIRRKEAEMEIANENKQIGYENALAETKAKKEAALAANDASRRVGLSKFLQGIADRARPARQAAYQAEDIPFEIEQEQKAQQKKTDQFLNAAKISESMKDREEARAARRAQDEANRIERDKLGMLAHEDRLKAINMGVYGKGFLPSVEGPPVPAPKSRLPLKTQAEIEHLQQITSKGPATSKGATPDERAAIKRLEGAKQSYEKASSQRLSYMAKQGPNAELKSDTTYIALTKATEQAAKDYQQADAELRNLTKTPKQRLTPSEAMKLPKGTHFIGTDGKEYVRP